MPLGGHYILRGKELVPVDMMTWARWFEGRDGRRIVGFWKFKSCDVSTVFLGLDHSFTEGAPPVVFETLVFGGPMDGGGERYCTYDEAEAGHLHYCERVRDIERTMNWRRAKRYRNHYEAQRRKWNDRAYRARSLREMKKLSDKMSNPGS